MNVFTVTLESTKYASFLYAVCSSIVYTAISVDSFFCYFSNNNNIYVCIYIYIEREREREVR